MSRAAAIAALVLSASAFATGQEPRIRTWSDSITLRPSGLRVRLPADGVRWQQESGVSHGDTVYVLVGILLPEGTTVSLQIDFAPALVMGRSVGDCAAYLEALRRGYAPHDPLSRLRIVSRPGWVPSGSGWSRRVIATDRATQTACHDGGRRPVIVETSDDPGTPQVARAVRGLLRLVGDAASRVVDRR
jgi:hypothetical protein